MASPGTLADDPALRLHPAAAALVRRALVVAVFLPDRLKAKEIQAEHARDSENPERRQPPYCYGAVRRSKQRKERATGH
jgi:hypothetical protein